MGWNLKRAVPPGWVKFVSLPLQRPIRDLECHSLASQLIVLLVDPADTRRPSETPDVAVAPYLRPKRQPPLHLPLAGPEVVPRPRGRGGPESPPSNRYAGDWSVCGGDLLPRGRDFLSGPDYDHVTASDSEEDDDEPGEPRSTTDFEDEFDAPFNPHLNLKDFDALILDLERELSKQINVCL